MRDASAQGRSRVGHWAFLALVTLAGVMLCGEAIVRIARPSGVVPERHFDPGIYASDDERGWALQAGYRGVWRDWEASMPTSTNSLGYRGPEEAPARLGAALRVAVLGDSVAFGRGVADGESYPALLEARLAAAGRDAAVFNLAVPGYDSTRERLTFEQHVERIDPHVVVVGWFRNDITDTQPAAERGGLEVIDGQLIADREAYDSFRRRMRASGVLDASMLVNFVRVRWSLWRKGVRLVRRRADFHAQVLPREAYAQTLAELSRIQAASHARGAAFVLVVHPGLDELGGDEPDSTAVLRGALATGSGAPATSVVSVAQEWNRVDDVRALYQVGDRGHPSPAGNASIVDLLVALPVFAR